MRASEQHLLVPHFLLLLLLTHSCASSFPSSTTTTPHALVDRYTIHRRTGGGLALPHPTEYVDPSLPPLFPGQTPTCSVHLLHHEFANTYGFPPVTSNYTPPDRTACGDWANAVLDLSVSCAGEQYDRIAAVWFDGVELLRTSTAEPTEAGVFWKVRKDVTRFASLLRANGVVSMMLENIVNDVYTGIYHVNLSLHFYGEERSKIALNYGGHLGFPVPSGSSGKIGIKEFRGAARIDGDQRFSVLYGKPADLIIPVSNEEGAGNGGFWFRLRNRADDVRARTIRIPSNAYRAVLEVYISFHSDDEFWYSNPPNDYIELNHIATERGNGSFREVCAMVDGRLVGSIVPYPVVFTGGINPLFWAPVVSIGAFDLPSYDLELTPFLGNLLDGEPHEFAFGVTDGIAYWLVDANLHLWLDKEASVLKAKLVNYNVPTYSISRESKLDNLDGKFKIIADEEAYFVGWVNSSVGNLTTIVERKFEFKSTVEFTRNGNVKEVYTMSKSETDVKIKSGDRVLTRQSLESKFPLWFQTCMVPGGNNTYTALTNLSHAFYEKSSIFLDEASYMNTINDKQTASGWMEVEGHSVLSGFTNTEQTYMHADKTGCYLRTVTTQDGKIQVDEFSNFCAFMSM